MICSRPVVLVVEDDQLQRMFAATMIEGSGLVDVVEAGNADEAIAILEAKDIRIVFVGDYRRRWDQRMAKTSARHPRSLAADRIPFPDPPGEDIDQGASDIPARSHFLLKPA